MIFIKKKNIKSKLKLSKQSLKLISTIIICIFVVLEVVLYAHKYYTNNNLCFTEEDKFLFTTIIISIFFVCALLIYLTIKQKTLLDLLRQVYEAIVDSEDNIIKLQRNTQEMIIKNFKKQED